MPRRLESAIYDRNHLSPVERFGLNHPILSAEEERDIFLSLSGAPPGSPEEKRLHSNLLAHNQRFVFSKAVGVKGLSNVIAPLADVTLDDLFQEGNMALWNAIPKFDPRVGIRLFKFAEKGVVWEMVRYIKEQGQTISWPVWATDLYPKIWSMYGRLTNATPDVIAKALDISPKTVNSVLEGVRVTDSLDRRVATEDGQQKTLLDTLKPPAERSFDEEVVQNDALMQVKVLLEDALNQVLAGKKPRDIEMFIKYFDLDHATGNFPSMADLGAEYGVTKVRVGQIVNGILGRIREFKASNTLRAHYMLLER